MNTCGVFGSSRGGSGVGIGVGSGVGVGVGGTVAAGTGSALGAGGTVPSGAAKMSVVGTGVSNEGVGSGGSLSSMREQAPRSHIIQTATKAQSSLFILILLIR